MALPSTSSIPKSFQYDVFLSFRGEDTRKTFVDHLYLALLRKNITTFKDDKNMEKGERITNELIKAIESSRFYIIVFSKNYASSSWCLDELVKIMESQKTTEQKAYPIFYDVEPTEVRKQSGVFGEGFDGRRMDEDAGKWIEALKEAADLSGWELKSTANGHEGQFIQKVVEEISQKIPFIGSSVDETLVGMGTQIDTIISSLETCVDDVRMIGIWGIGGGGKTTLARAVFDLMSSRFEHRSFLEDVREVTKPSFSGFKKLKKRMLRDMLNQQVVDVKMFKAVTCHLRVLVVLDDVDDIEQLEKLAQKDWFAPGSAIIITTRDKQVLIAHGVKLIHDVNKLSDEEAICLFNRFAFEGKISNQRYEELSQQLVRYADGLPLTIKVLGSDLRGKDEHEWKETLEKLKRIPPEEVLKRLELSYEGLTEENKRIFLDVACFWKGERKDRAIRALESLQLHPILGLRDLERKSLITISEYKLYDHGVYWEIIQMHDRIQDMAREIVRREHPYEPYRRSRLWDNEEIEKILAEDLGCGATIGIKLTVKWNQQIHMKGLRKMKNLKFLHMIYETEDDYYYSDEKSCEEDDYYSPDGVSQYFPNSLQYLFWENCPFKCLANTFPAKYLVGLEMVNYCGEQLWENEERKVLNKLKFLVLNNSELTTLNLGHVTPNLELLSIEGGYLEELQMPGNYPKLKSVTFYALKLKSFDLGKTPNLETLYFEGCYHLEELHMPENYPKLKSLILGTLHLKSFDLGETSNLETLDLRECYHLEELHMSGNYPKLKSIYLTYSKLKSFNLGETSNLEMLDLGGCSHLEEFHMPGSLDVVDSELKSFDHGKTPNLETLDLGGCSCLEELHMLGNFPKLKSLFLGTPNLKSFDLGETPNLETLDLRACYDLEELHMPGNYPKLKSLFLGTSKLKSFDLGKTPNLEILDLNECVYFEELHMPKECPTLKSLVLGVSYIKSFDCRKTPNLEILKLDEASSHGPGSKKYKHSNICCIDLRRTLNLKELVVRSHSSNLIQLLTPNGFLELKSLELKHAVLWRTLDLGRAPNLELLSREGCDEPVDNHMVLECPYLLSLYLSCSNLKNLNLVMTPHLNTLNLGSCDSLVEISFGGVPKLKCIRVVGSNKLQTLDLRQCVNLETLTLDSCDSLVEVSIGWMPKLKDLTLLGLNKLETLDLRQCVNLETLVLNDSVLLEYIYLDNSNLTTLQLGTSRLGFIPSWGSPSLPKLRTLDISMTPNLKSLTLFGCKDSQLKMPLEHPKLKTLTIDCSMLKTLWLRTPNLECLDLVCCSDFLKLQMLDECRRLNQIRFEPNLKKLSIIGNIPNNFGGLPFLYWGISEFLNWNHSVGICKLRHLRVLELESCHLLEKLPEDLGQLVCLEELTIQNCKSLRGIPDDICKLKHLKYLCLRHCIAVEKLPEMLGNLKSLEDLDIEDTSISHLPQGIVLFKDLRIIGSKLLLQSCEFTSQIRTLDYEMFYYRGTRSSSLLKCVSPTTGDSSTKPYINI